MSNLEFARPIRSYSDAARFMEDAPHGNVRRKKLCYETIVSESINWNTGTPSKYSVSHHGNRIAEFRKVADCLYIPKWTDHRYGGKYANVFGIDQFAIIASFDNCGYATNTTANRLNRMIPDYAPRGLSIGISTIEQTSPIYGFKFRGPHMVARIDGYEYPFNTLHFTLSGDVIAYCDGKPYRVAQRRAADFQRS